MDRTVGRNDKPSVAALICRNLHLQFERQNVRNVTCRRLAGKEEATS